ncbi:MAG: hypothetical protein K2J00_06635 [Bacteroidaceae bacterium]|nr:hypothetical protein [Bacteroidaceae bacterium]
MGFLIKDKLADTIIPDVDLNPCHYPLLRARILYIMYRAGERMSRKRRVFVIIFQHATGHPWNGRTGLSDASSRCPKCVIVILRFRHRGLEP